MASVLRVVRMPLIAIHSLSYKKSLLIIASLIASGVAVNKIIKYLQNNPHIINAILNYVRNQFASFTKQSFISRQIQKVAIHFVADISSIVLGQNSVITQIIQFIASFF